MCYQDLCNKLLHISFVDTSSMASEDEKLFESDDDDDEYFEVYIHVYLKSMCRW